jgi:mono/diheme cytochrome c family protein
VSPLRVCGMPSLALVALTLAGVIAYVKNPTGSMPHLYPTPLGDSDVAAVAAYVMTLRQSH